jgi:RNA polymerase sigma-70 factor (ECF subfamily)
VLARLDEYRGLSRFTTWSSKFALLEAAVRLRKLSWQSESRVDLACAELERTRELRSTVEKAMAEALTRSERHVFETLVFNGVPIDVLADQLQTSRGDVYETLRKARTAIGRHVNSSSTPFD